jgi:hypothetical protein
MPNWGEGPFEAIEEFLKNNDSFEIDKDREKYYMTFNPNGYLRKNKRISHAQFSERCYGSISGSTKGSLLLLRIPSIGR